MPIIRTGHGEYERELARFEQLPHDVIAVDRETGDRLKPGNPYTYRPFPKMLYKALPSPLSNGKALCMEPMPSPFAYTDDKLYQRAILAAETFNKSCTFIVRSDDEYRTAKNNGWRESPADALAHHEGLQKDIANAAAEANFAAARMTSKAQSERKQRESATDKHVPD